MPLNDNPYALTSTNPAGLPDGTKPMLVPGTFSGDADVLVAPALLAGSTGAEGSRQHYLLPTDPVYGQGVDVTRSALPNGAATSANQTTTNTALGAPADSAASSDAGTFSIIAFIKRALSNWTTLLGRIPASVSGRVPVDGSGVTQPISATALPLPTGAATEATLQQVRDSIRAQIDLASTLWTDDSGTYYVRRDTVNQFTGVVTITFTLADGTNATPGTGLRPLSTVDRDVTQTLFEALSGGTGYSTGDLIARVMVINAVASPAVVTSFWFNITTGSTLGTAPTFSTLERADESIGARQIGTWTVTGPLTDAQLRATAVAISAASLPLPTGAAQDRTTAGAPMAVRMSDGSAFVTPYSRGAGAVDANTQRLTVASDAPLMTSLGATNDAEATGDGSSIAILKRLRTLLGNIDGKLPALVSSRVPVSLTAGLGTAWGTRTTLAMALTSLAGGAGAQSDMIDLSGTRASDVLFEIQTRSSGADTGFIDFYLYWSLGNTVYTDGASGTSGSFTVANRLASRLIWSQQLNGTNNVPFQFLLSDVMASVPPRVGLIAIKRATPALSSTSADHVVAYQVITGAA